MKSYLNFNIICISYFFTLQIYQKRWIFWDRLRHQHLTFLSLIYSLGDGFHLACFSSRNSWQRNVDKMKPVVGEKILTFPIYLFCYLLLSASWSRRTNLETQHQNRDKLCYLRDFRDSLSLMLLLLLGLFLLDHSPGDLTLCQSLTTAVASSYRHVRSPWVARMETNNESRADPPHNWKVNSEIEG